MEDWLGEGSILTDDFLRELMNVGEVDILIGVPTYNDARPWAKWSRPFAPACSSIFLVTAP